MTQLKVDQVSFAYQDKEWVLKNISFSVEKGEKIAVIGANGAGKSTLFLHLNGVLRPDRGCISLWGERVGETERELTRLRRAAGIVFQEADTQIIAGSVLGEVSFGPMNMGLGEKQARACAERAIIQTGLSGYEERAPHYLSGGEKKRVTIADILAMEPEIIMFDEPTASLDPENVRALEETLKILEKKQVTLLISTHDMNFVYGWADRVLVFAGGELIGDGAAESIFADKDLLMKAGLSRPMLMEMWEILEEKGLVREKQAYPRSLDELRERIQTAQPVQA